MYIGDMYRTSLTTTPILITLQYAWIDQISEISRKNAYRCIITCIPNETRLCNYYTFVYDYIK